MLQAGIPIFQGGYNLQALKTATPSYFDFKPSTFVEYGRGQKFSNPKQNTKYYRFDQICNQNPPTHMRGTSLIFLHLGTAVMHALKIKLSSRKNICVLITWKYYKPRSNTYNSIYMHKIAMSCQEQLMSTFRQNTWLTQNLAQKLANTVNHRQPLQPRC